MVKPYFPISTEARRRLRGIWAQLETEAQAIETAARNIPVELVRDLRQKFGRGADRAGDQIAARMPIASLARRRRGLTWRYIRPVVHDEQPELKVSGVFVNAPGLPGIAVLPFALTIAFHAVGRLLDRSSFQADPVRSILEAHDALLALSPDECLRLFALPRFMLPGGQGAFLVTASRNPAMLTARTWIDADQFGDDQERDANAWSQVAHLSIKRHETYQGVERS